MFLERVFAFFQADGVHHALALGTFKPGFDDIPFGAVDHQRHTGNIGLGCDEVQEPHHLCLRLQHGVVHIDVDDLRAVFHLDAANVEGGLVFTFGDQIFELGRARHVAAFAHVDEPGHVVEDQRFQPGQTAYAFSFRKGARGHAFHGVGNGADVIGRGAAAPAHDV